MRNLILLAVVLVALTARAVAESPETVNPIEVFGSIEIVDPAAEQLIDPKANIEKLATGFEWCEGPVWVKEGGYVIFSDVPRNSIYKWQEGEGLSLYLKPSGYTGFTGRGGESGSNGLAINAEGQLILCQHGDHRVARMDAPISSPEPTFTTITAKWHGEELNSPNDLVIHSSGAIYFTDPPYGRIGTFESQDRPLDFQGVYRIMPGEALELLTKKLRAPNGIGLSPDEKTLYVAQSDPKNPIYIVYNVLEDGTIDEGRVLFDSSALYKKTPGNPDGLAIDQYGNLWATGPGGVLVITPEGKHLATIHTGEKIANCAFGDDGSTLYMTSDMHFCRVKTKTIGLGF